MSAPRLHSLMAPTNNKKNETMHLLKSMTSVVCPLSFPDPVVCFGHTISIAKLCGSGNENVVGLFSSSDPFVYFDHVVSFVIN